MLRPDLTTPGGARVKLLNFGIAKLTNQSTLDIKDLCGLAVSRNLEAGRRV
jgi:hypothetical protein